VCVESDLIIRSQNEIPRVSHHGLVDHEDSGSHGKGHKHNQHYERNGKTEKCFKHNF